MAKKGDTPLPEQTLDELQAVAKKLDIKGRSSMKKEELVAAIMREETQRSPFGEAPEGFVPEDAYAEVLQDNERLRFQLQQKIQGSVGAPRLGAPGPGEALV